jgi:hypothetical protein
MVVLKAETFEAVYTVQLTAREMLVLRIALDEVDSEVLIRAGQKWIAPPGSTEAGKEERRGQYIKMYQALSTALDQYTK